MQKKNFQVSQQAHHYGLDHHQPQHTIDFHNVGNTRNFDRLYGHSSVDVVADKGAYNKMKIRDKYRNDDARK